jgi:GST-like protein
VLNNQLSDGRAFICGDDYTIADMACYPWIVPHERQRQNLQDFPALAGWFARIAARPATQRAYALAASISEQPTVDAKSSAILFGQDAKTVR